MRRSIVLLFALALGGACSPEPSDKGDGGGSDVGGADLGGDSSGSDGGSDVGVPDSGGDGGGDGFCPVVGYEPCGGDLVGTWAFRSLCPEDPEAAAALCEHPYDDREECTTEGNSAVCDSSLAGTLTFGADGTLQVDTVSTLVATWTFTDTCLATINREPTPQAQCAAIANDRLTCEYDGVCTCVGIPLSEPETNTATYTIDGMEVVLGEDPPATYCVDGDRLTMDYYLYHPISWRYWVLERQ